MRDVAKTFWANTKCYPQYGNIKERRLHELNYIIPVVRDCKSLLDIGCGDGALLTCLRHLTNIDTLIGFDYSVNLLNSIKDDSIETRYFDCYNPLDIPKADATIIGGVMIYLFDDNIISNLLSLITSPLLLVRNPCTILDSTEYINKYSQKLDSNYSARYHTIDHLSDIISKSHDIEEVVRIYPDALEHTPSTRQYYFKCRRKV